MENITGMKVAILIEDGFEQVEMVEPRKALDQAGAETSVVSPRNERVRAWNFTEWGDDFPVDVALDRARPDDFDALLLPGGVINPDKLRMQPKAVAFAKAFFDAGKPVAAICHGPWTVIETGAARGRRIASWPSLKTDLRNAGAEWMDQEVVVDRKPRVQLQARRHSSVKPRDDQVVRPNRHGKRTISPDSRLIAGSDSVGARFIQTNRRQVMLNPPVSKRDHVIGPWNAKIVVVEYGDFECPYCAAAEPVLRALRQALAGSLLFAFRHFPLAEAHPYDM